MILKRPVSYIHITSNIKLFYVLSSRITLHFNYVSLFFKKNMNGLALFSVPEGRKNTILLNTCFLAAQKLLRKTILHLNITSWMVDSN